ncbi:MAG: tripartite tricarboxylate transporter TctB family protein [Clostridia bacterium]|nr:tripartite tricarboxylate transporter TctB family protein [Clostridia bacterium]
MIQYADAFFGAGVMVFGAIYLWQLNKLSGETTLFPRALLYVIIFSGLAMIVRALRKAKAGKAETEFSGKAFLRDALIPGGILLFFTWALTKVGFYIGTFLVFCAICVLEEVTIKGKFRPPMKELLKMLLAAVVSTGFMYICFAVLLKLPTPRGPLGF